MARERWRDVATDHFDVAAQRFFNPWGQIDRGIPDLLRWWWTGNKEPWPDAVTNRPYLAPPGAIPEGQVAITMIGHACTLVRVDGFTLLTDPQFSTHAGPFGRLGTPRVRPPGIEPRDLPAINAVFVSHNHYDHLDLASLRWLTLQRAPAAFVVPLGLKRPLERHGIGPVIELDWWETTDVIGAEITMTPAMHWSSRTMADRRKTLWGGCTLRVPYAPRIYFAGDTGYARFFTEVRERLGAPDVALLPIGAYEPRWFMEPFHMNPADAVRAHQEVGARVSIATHHSYFRLADDGFDSPARLLADARASAGVPPEDFRVLDVGETVVLGA
jgi:L-ascorbate metabolism protein UlaG (beta-lactamase superfamily)